MRFLHHTHQILLPIVLVRIAGIPVGTGGLAIELLQPRVHSVVGSIEGLDQRLAQANLVLQNGHVGVELGGRDAGEHHGKGFDQRVAHHAAVNPGAHTEDRAAIDRRGGHKDFDRTCE